ncbi:hypothetical protein F6455_16475 [Proteobacteria bacterium 005FR1]|nr:hypothetical protein [Proteobacteria bacterium 005FR1]
MFDRLLQKIPELSHWVTNNDQLLFGVAIASLAVFLASLALIPWLLVRIPPDYFSRAHERRSLLAGYNPFLVIVLRVLRNVLAVIFIVLGLLMLVLPGQGLLTLFLGLVVADFPGKHGLVNWLVSHPSICRPINWLRRRAGRQPLEMPE